MWKWLKDGSNQKILALLGSGVAAVVIAIWTAYVHFFPAKKPSMTKQGVLVEARCGVAAGNDVIEGNITVSCGLDQEGIESVIGATIDQFDINKIVAELASSSRDQNEAQALAAALGISEDSLGLLLQEIRADSSSQGTVSASLTQLLISKMRIVVTAKERQPDEVLSGAAGMPPECPNDLSGKWAGSSDWGAVDLWAVGRNRYMGTYTGTWGTQDKGLITLSVEFRNEICGGSGFWGEGEVSAGDLFDMKVLKNGNSIRGFWSRTVHFRNEFVERQSFEWNRR